MSQVVLDRDMWRCVRCGSSGPLHVHHRILGNRKDNRPSNLVTLCLVCHEWVHSRREDSKAGGLVVSRHGPREATTVVPVRTRFGPVLLADDGTWKALNGGARESGHV